ncbi:MAG: type IV pilus modification protein PilV [Gammaproteobacteria bacterium]|nr:type IV pilus modification protein PilV [Gammaproteobacteria bacterium]
MNDYPAKGAVNEGTSLLEVLIAAVILGIGLLGISALQLTSLQGAGNAEYRGRASDFASSLTERMRANKPGSDSYLSSALPVDNSDYCRTQPPVICSMNPVNIDVADISICTPEQLAAYDLWEIRCSNGVRNSLPGGQLMVTSQAAGVYQIQINWLTRTRNSADGEKRDVLSMTVMPGIAQDL